MKKVQNKRDWMGWNGSSLNAPGIKIHLSHPILELCEIHFSYYWPSGVIRNGSPVWKWKWWKSLRTKGAEWAGNGPFWLPQALKTFCLIQFWGWKNSLFPLLVLWGNRNWPPSMKVKKLETFWDKSSKWSSLNAKLTEILFLTLVGRTPFSHFQPFSLWYAASLEWFRETFTFNSDYKWNVSSKQLIGDRSCCEILMRKNNISQRNPNQNMPHSELKW